MSEPNPIERSDELRADELRRRLAGTRALVTGANGAIGDGVVEALAGAGCVVMATDIQSECRADRKERMYVGADLADETAAETLFEHAVERSEGLDIVINCAGIGHADPLDSLTLETWQRVFAINVEAAFTVSRLAVRQMSGQAMSPAAARRGLIIHVTSGAAEIGRPLSAAYGASKAALNHLCKSLAATYADRSIATAAVAPGVVEAGMLRYLMPGLEQAAGSAHVDARRVESLLFDLEQTPAEVGALVAAVASRPGMAMNGRELWTTPTIGPIA